jgi:hypothetical protein
MGNLFTSQATISFPERVVLHVIEGFHTSYPAMTLFPREGKGQGTAEVDLWERWLGT